MIVQKETAHSSTNAPLNTQKYSGEDTQGALAVNSVESQTFGQAVQEAETWHVFETKSDSKAFRKEFGVEEKIMYEGVGWRAGHALPDNVIAYLWPCRTDEAGRLWLREVAATTKATLKLPRVVSDGCCLKDLIRYAADAEVGLPYMLSDAETVPNTNEPTSYDALVRLAEQADALTPDEFFSDFVQNEKALWRNRHKHDEPPAKMPSDDYFKKKVWDRFKPEWSKLGFDVWPTEFREKPKVELPCDGRLLSQFAADIGEQLRGCGLYERGGLPFILNQQRDGLELVTSQMLRTLAENYLVCHRVRRAGESQVSHDRTMSEADARGVLCAQQFLSRLPKLERVATTRLPVMRPDGKIELLQTGYDSDSLTLTIAQCDYSETLSLDEARKRIHDLLSEFCFADKGRSKAVAVAAMVTLYAVALLPKGALRPVFIYLANAEGAGKTMLAKCAIAPVHGFVDTEGAPKDKAEVAKELLTAVMEGRSYSLLDNCKGHLDSAQLEAFTSSIRWKGRVLGASKSFCGENNVTVFITGNSCTVSPDIRRRSLFVELFMEQERAEDRSFKRILDDGALLDMRPDILAALWAMVREWDAAGRPKPTRTHSSFPRWADIIAGIVEFAGFGCPLETADIQSASDVDGADMRELVAVIGSDPVKFDELVSLAREKGLFERLLSGDGELKPNDKSAFGKLLKRYDRRVFHDSKRFVVEGRGHSRRFMALTETEALARSQGQQGVSTVEENFLDV